MLGWSIGVYGLRSSGYYDEGNYLLVRSKVKRAVRNITRTSFPHKFAPLCNTVGANPDSTSVPHDLLGKSIHHQHHYSESVTVVVGGTLPFQSVAEVRNFVSCRKINRLSNIAHVTSTLEPCSGSMVICQGAVRYNMPLQLCFYRVRCEVIISTSGSQLHTKSYIFH